MSKLGEILKARASAWAAQRASDEIGRGDLRDEDEAYELESGIHAAPSSRAPVSPLAGLAGEGRAKFDTDPLALGEVTLIVTAWHNVQPGAMGWVFPTARQAIVAAKAMRNAVAWAIVRGKQPATALEEARAKGAVLLEHRS